MKVQLAIVVLIIALFAIPSVSATVYSISEDATNRYYTYHGDTVTIPKYLNVTEYYNKVSPSLTFPKSQLVSRYINYNATVAYLVFPYSLSRVKDFADLHNIRLGNWHFDTNISIFDDAGHTFNPTFYDFKIVNDEIRLYFNKSEANKLSGNITFQMNSWTCEGCATGTFQQTFTNLTNNSIISLPSPINASSGYINFSGIIPEQRIPIFLNNTGNATTLSYFQVPINLTWVSGMAQDFSNIHIKNSTGVEQPFWIENQVNGSNASIWGNFSSIPGGVWTNSTYYIYFRNSTEISRSNATNTFVFSDITCELSKWTVTGNATCNNNGIKITANGNWNQNGILGKTVLRKPYIMEWEAILSGTNNNEYSGVSPAISNFINVGTGLLRYTPGSRVLFSKINTTDTDTGTVWNYNVKYRQKMIIDSNNYYYYINNSIVKTGAMGGMTANNWSAAAMVGAVSGDYTVYTNWTVRKYASPEPTVQAGTTQQLVTNVFAHPQNHPVSENNSTTTDTVTTNLIINAGIPIQNITVYSNDTYPFNITVFLYTYENFVQIDDVCSAGTCTTNLNMTHSNNLTGSNLTLPKNVIATGAQFQGNSSIVSTNNSNATVSWNATHIIINEGVVNNSFNYTYQLKYYYNNAPSGSVTNMSCEYQSSCNLNVSGSDTEGNPLELKSITNGTSKTGVSPHDWSGLSIGNHTGVFWINETSNTVSPLQKVSYDFWINITLDVTAPITPFISSSNKQQTTIDIISSNETEYAIYSWYYSLNGSGNFTFWANTTIDTTTISNLTSCEIYDYKLRVFDISGNPSDWSTTITEQQLCFDPEYQVIIQRLSAIEAMQLQQNEETDMSNDILWLISYGIYFILIYIFYKEIVK